jgi:hypothetical protein
METEELNAAGIKFLKSALFELALPFKIPDEELIYVLNIVRGQDKLFVVNDEIIFQMAGMQQQVDDEVRDSADRHFRSAFIRRKIEWAEFERSREEKGHGK